MHECLSHRSEVPSLVKGDCSEATSPVEQTITLLSFHVPIFTVDKDAKHRRFNWAGVSDEDQVDECSNGHVVLLSSPPTILRQPVW